MQRFRRAVLTWFGLAALLGTSIAAVGVAADPLATWTAGPGGVGESTYTGFIDVPSADATVPTGSFQLIGWFVDMTAQGWAGADDIQVFQGSMDGGGKMLARANFGQSRPDVAAALGNPFWAAAGFTATIPTGSLSPGPTPLSVYAHTPGNGWWFKQVQVIVAAGATASAPAPAAAASVSGGSLPVVAIEKPKDSEQVLTKNDYEIAGYALDKSAAPNQGFAGSGIDRVQVYLGAERENGGRYLGDADLGYSDSVPQALYGSQFASAGWRLTFKPTQFHVNTYIVFAYAHSAVTGKEDVAQRFFAIRDTSRQ